MKILNTVILILMPITFTIAIYIYTFKEGSLFILIFSLCGSIFAFVLALTNRKLIRKAEEME